jgi:hypothetical protein
MPVSVESSVDIATSALAAAHFERILDVPYLPANNQQRVYYPLSVDTGQSLGRWYLRVAGLDFTIVNRSWVRAGMRRCYSLGWGGTDRGQIPHLLLAQAFSATETDAHTTCELMVDQLAPVSDRLSSRVDEQWGWHCVRLCAELRSTRPGAGDG